MPSPRWRGTGVLVAGAGVVFGLLALTVILGIDNTINADQMNAAQDVVGTVATVAGFGVAGGGIYCAFRWWRRPCLRVTPDGIEVHNWRPVLVPWSMIGGVDTFQPDTGDRRPALVLHDGRLVPVLFAEPVRMDMSEMSYEPALDRSSVAKTVRAELAARSEAQVLAVTTPVRSESSDAVPTRRLPRVRRPSLPDAFGQRMPRPPAPIASMLSVFWGVMLIGGGRSASLQKNSGHPFNFAQWGLIIAALIAGCAISFVFWWSAATRALVVGQDWLAWHPRLARSWRVIELGDVISVATPMKPNTTPSIVVKRLDGRGVIITTRELSAGASRLLAAMLADNAAVTPGARDVLAAASGA